MTVIRFLTSGDGDDNDQESHYNDGHNYADDLGAFVSYLKLLFKFLLIKVFLIMFLYIDIHVCVHFKIFIKLVLLYD